MSCRGVGWGGGYISSLTLVFKLFWWSFPQAVCQDYRCLPLPVFPSFLTCFYFIFASSESFYCKIPALTLAKRPEDFFFEAWTLTPSEPENGNRDNLSIPLKLDFSWGRGSARIFVVQYFKTPWWYRVTKAKGCVENLYMYIYFGWEK